MNKLYNTQKDISSGLANFIKLNVNNIRKSQLNILPYIIFGMISSESCATIDIAKNLKDDFCNVFLPSTQRRIRRFFNNSLFNGHDFYSQIISSVIKNYKCKHNDNRIHIAMDHMFIRDRFTKLMKHIDSIGQFYVFRLKNNYKCLIYDKHEKHYIWKYIKNLTNYQFKTAYYNDIYFTKNKVKTNIVISPRKPKSLVDKGLHDEVDPWILITNENTKFAIKDYGYRFGAIEFLFKSQKSNGFFLEKTTISNLHALTNMFSCVCFSILLLTILGSDYPKNTKCYKNIKIDCVRNYKSSRKRIMSLFKTGLALFNIAFNSIKYIRLPYNFKLYDY